MGNEEIDMFILRLIKLLKSDLNHNGEVIVPYLGKFYLKRMPPRKRSILDFGSDERYTVEIPAMDKLKFKVNKNFSKLFR